MNIKFIRNIFFPVVICLLLVSCEGKDCIEADDFGEYDTDVITIESKSPDCGLNSSNIVQSSPAVRECIENEINAIEFEGSYRIKNHEDKNISCYELYSCYSEGGNCYDDYKVYTVIKSQSTETENEITEYTANAQSFLQKAYNACSENCISTCLANTDLNKAFETGWVPNNKKDDKSGIGIKLPLGQTVDIQVVGNVKLTEASQQNLRFAIGEEQDSLYKIFKNGKYFRDSLGPTLFGGWCLGTKTNIGTECPNNIDQNKMWIGEINNEVENITQRYQFLRRGVVILTHIPDKGKIDDNDNYIGPDLFPDYSKWNCSYDSNIKTADCKTNYDTGDYKTENNINFAMDNDFVKINGGLVIPEQVKEFILSAPKTNIIETGINVITLNNTPLNTYSVTETDDNTITPNNTSLNTYKFKNLLQINSLYPIKLAFSAPDLEDSSDPNNPNHCKITIGQYEVNIDSTNKNNWFFISDNNGKPIVFNKNDYNTLKPNKNTIDWNENYMFNINVDASNCQNKSKTDYIPVYVFMMPQNEILINKSGFVSFKTLLGNFEGQEIHFDIINPMYQKSDNNTYLKDNFYEYIDKPNLQTATLQNDNWSNEVFVRKGQILRFNSDNWFDIVENSNGGYTIKQKTTNIDLNNDIANISIGDGLVLKIEYRPALLCSGTAKEKVDNPNCNKKYNDDGSVICADTRYSEICQAYKDDQNNFRYDYYCPMGCYCEDEGCQKVGYIAGAADFKVQCLYDSYANANTCAACLTKLGTNTQSPTTELDLIQCYDLENYEGAVRNLFDQNNADKLTTNAKALGAKTLSSIFAGGNYGNLDGMTVDTSYKNFSNLTFSEFKYNSPSATSDLSPKINSKNKYLSFLIIDNKDFEFNSDSNSLGEYNLIFNPEKTFSKGEQLAIALVNNNTWDGDEDSEDFRGWLVQYNTNKKDNENYGTINNTSPYRFDNNGYITNSIIVNSKSGNTDNLRLFFKIIDKPEKNTCNGSTTEVPYEEVLCKCASGKNSTSFQSCEILTCDAPEKDENGNFKPIDIITQTTSTCANSYYNNSGTYTVKLKTPKDTTNATSYIVKYIMQPILEILDGKSVGLQVDNDNKLIPCQSENNTFIYGGNLSRSRVGTVCIPGDPLVGEYCKKATFSAPSGTCDNCVVGQECDPDCKILKHGDRVNANVFYKGAYALLPGARENFWGKDCDSDTIKNSGILNTIYGTYPNYCYHINGRYIYGGDLAKERVGTVCDSNDPLVGEYCKKATFSAPSGTCDNCVVGQECDPDCKILKHGDRVNANVFYAGNYALLPGARANFWGKDCDSDTIKNSGILAANYGEYPNYCYHEADKCAFYFPESQFSEYEKRFGESCNPSDNKQDEPIICYKTCSGLDDSLYSKHCQYFNNGGGFLQRFYVAVITDNYYQTIVKLCFVLMITFYGMYYLMGMAELTHTELIKRAFKISFIYLMIGTKGWEYYNMFFVKFFKQGVDYLVFAVASAFDDNTDLIRAFIKGDFYDKSVLFSGVDKNLSLLFSDAVSYKIWGLFFVSFFGWLYVFIIYSSILTYIFSVANAMLLYVTAQFFLSLLLAMGPIFLVMLIFDKTKEIFNKWISNLISFGLEQIFLLTCLSLFNILVYNIIKYVLSFRVCWKAVWEMNIPLLGSLQMMSFWKATTSTSATAAATAVPGLFQILLIYLIADLMGKFIELSTQLGGSIGGSGMYLNFLSDSIKGDAAKFYDNYIKKPIHNQAQKIGTDFLKQTIGYKTADEEKKETENSKKARKAFRDANYKADRAVSKYIKENSAEWVGMSTDQRRAKIADIRKAAFIDTLKQNGGESAIKNMGLTYIDANGEKKEIKNAEDVYNSRIVDKDLQVSHSFLGRMGKQNDVLKTAGKAFQHFDKTEKFGRGLEHVGDLSVRTLISPHNFGQGIKNLTVSTLKDGEFINNAGAFISPQRKEDQIKKGKSNIGDPNSRQIIEAAYYEAGKQKEANKPTGLNWFNPFAQIRYARDVRKEAKLKEVQLKEQYNQKNVPSSDSDASHTSTSTVSGRHTPPSYPPSPPPDSAPNDGELPGDGAPDDGELPGDGAPDDGELPEDHTTGIITGTDPDLEKLGLEPEYEIVDSEIK